MPFQRLSFRAPMDGAYTPIGAMCCSITLLTPGGQAEDGSTLDPTAAGNTFAAIRPLSGQELYQAQQIAQEVSHLVTIPYQPGVMGKMQVRFDGRTFQIKAIQDPDGRKVELRLLCSERGQSPS